jgi:hypothetical protein
MDTHEHLIPDDDLPGAGMIVPEFARQQLREAEEAGMIVWDDEHEHYHASARGHLVRAAAMIFQRAGEISPDASIQEITQAVVSCLPWAEGVTAIPADEHERIETLLADHGFSPVAWTASSDGEVLPPLDPDSVEGAFDDVTPDDIINGGQS